MENILPYIIQIGELIGAAILGGWISRVLTIRSRVRQENAGAGKAEAEAKASQIENIEALVEKVYKPTIEQLTARVEKLQGEVERLREDNNLLKDENDRLRDAIREIDPTIVPSKRSVNAQRQAAMQPRGANGQFTKKEG
jgi:peptidoglycan hydrolase CwlO-like protein